MADTPEGGSSAGPWFYSLKTHSVVTAETGGRAADRLGPFATRAEAQDALERVAQRNEAWDSQDDDDERS